MLVSSVIIILLVSTYSLLLSVRLVLLVCSFLLLVVCGLFYLIHILGSVSLLSLFFPTYNFIDFC